MFVKFELLIQWWREKARAEGVRVGLREREIESAADEELQYVKLEASIQTAPSVMMIESGAPSEEEVEMHPVKEQ